MGRCLAIGGKPFEINIQLPGGLKLASMSSATQQVPNIMDPFQSLLQVAQPAFGAIQPAFDIIGFVMQLMQCWVGIMRIFAALAVPVIGPFPPTNPMIAMFPPPPKLDPDTGDPLDPYQPDLTRLFTDFLECVAALMGKGLKVAGLVPQLSVPMSIKDIVITAMGFVDAAMAQVNSLTDLFTGLPPANTGNPIFDAILQCAADNSSTQLEHKLGPVGNLVPLMAIVSLLADAAKQPLPQVVHIMAKLLADEKPGGFGLIPFPDLTPVGGPSSERQREDFLALIEELTITGLPIEIPDFSDLSQLGALLTDMRAQLEPVLPAIELVQSIINKLTET